MKTIIIPTYNEEENIEHLIEMIFQYLNDSDLELIIVDDDSRDKTQDIVENAAQRFDRVKLVVRKNKRGLSSAVKRGAKEARDGPVVVMDADFSHHPRFLPAMFAKLDQGYDIVVGSRYASEGEIIGWPGSRIAISKIGTYLARTLLRIPVKDSVSGFVGCKSPQLLVSSIENAEYKFLVELLVKNRNLRVMEIPISFQNRVRGESKLDETTILLYIQLVFRLLFFPLLE